MTAKDTRIHSVEVIERKYALNKPYVLSFDTIRSIVSIQLTMRLSDGRSVLTETVPLPGYSDETADSILAYLNRKKTVIAGKKAEDVRRDVAADIPVNPFACSPVLTAIDLLSNDLYPQSGAVPMVTPATVEDTEGLKALLMKMEHNGGGTIKVKLSGKARPDLNCVRELNSTPFKATFIRFDANKAYTFDDAVRFYDALSEASFLKMVHYVEQPLAEADWTGHAALISRFNSVRTMLDESIVTENDLYRATDIRVPYVKFKLFKQGGIKELLNLANIAYSKGMKVVIGNGVATRISNDIENWIYSSHPQLFFGASEANGFLKIAGNE
ncbi:MAG: enolase C-terminal domain-like protein [Bacteroidota bacterium]